jgi:hypothetical protein
MAQHGIVVDRAQRQQLIREQLAAAAASVGGVVPDEPALLEEVTDLVEQPAAILGSFEAALSEPARRRSDQGHAEASALFSGGWYIGKLGNW